MSREPIRLNIGAGESQLPGFTPIDAKLGHDALKLPYEDGSVDEVYASHILEHFDRGDSERAIKEWFRVLKPGGRMRIAVPDVDKVLAKRRSDPSWEHRLMGGHSDEHDYHKTVWFDEKLRGFMQWVGLNNVRNWTADYADCSAHSISTNVEGIKPGGAPLHRVVSAGPIKLNIGAGYSELPGFIPIDMRFGHDATNLDYADNTVDEVYASHVLEHIHHSKVMDAIKEWVRVLKPGGRIRICIPDFDQIDRDRRSDPAAFNSYLYSCWMHGSTDQDTDRHLAWIDVDWLESMLRASGIEDIEPWEPEYEDYSHLKLTLHRGGYKRNVQIPRNPKVVMVLSVPRFGPCDTFKSIADACQSIGWKFFHWGGTEWGKGLEQVIEHVIKTENPDYIFPLDYDSVFDPQDCLKILEFMQRSPDVAAVWPSEAHRHMDLPLGMAPTGAAAGAYNFDGEFTEMWSGHFGCTMIRASVFKTIPHPWFMSLPDPNTGNWENSSDADITFWKSCTMHGLKVGQLNTVQIGHLEWCVKWMGVTPKGTARMIWQPIQHYRKSGKPKDAVFVGQAWVEKAKAHVNPPPAKAVVEIPAAPLAPIHPPHTAEEITPEDVRRGYKTTDKGTITIKPDPSSGAPELHEVRNRLNGVDQIQPAGVR